MSAFRAIPQNLTMGEPATFGQSWTYHAPHPMDDMQDVAYYVGVASRLRAGDSLRVVQLTNGRVAAVADMLVVGVDPLEFLPLRQHQVARQNAAPGRK